VAGELFGRGGELWRVLGEVRQLGTGGCEVPNIYIAKSQENRAGILKIVCWPPEEGRDGTHGIYPPHSTLLAFAAIG
jgi:hypothetical protein